MKLNNVQYSIFCLILFWYSISSLCFLSFLLEKEFIFCAIVCNGNLEDYKYAVCLLIWILQEVTTKRFPWVSETLNLHSIKAVMDYGNIWRWTEFISALWHSYKLLGTRELNVMVWIGMTPIDPHICVVSHQELELFDNIRYITMCGFIGQSVSVGMGFEILKAHAQCSLSFSACGPRYSSQ